MAQPAQIKFVDPNNSWNQIDNSAAPSFPSQNGTKELQGYDTPSVVPNGSNSQGSNPTSDTGSVLIDISGNDVIAFPNPKNSTVNGNPVSLTQFTYSTVTKVLNSNLTGISVAFKNPA